MQLVTTHQRVNGPHVRNNAELDYPHEIFYQRLVVRNKVIYDCVRIIDVLTIKSYLLPKVVQAASVRKMTAVV